MYCRDASDMIVTTAHTPSPSLEKLARYLADCLGIPCIPRGNQSLQHLQEHYDVTNILVATSSGPIVFNANGEYFFHLNMAELRIINLVNGKNDHMVDAMGLQRGLTVLDCTLGLATDAIVASCMVGESGKVIGLEISKIISTITAYGLQNFDCTNSQINSAMRRIDVMCVDYLDYLKQLPDNSFDVVYFDPMFRHPLYRSSNVQPLRLFADMRPLSHATLEEACRVATRRVVLKETRNSHEFQRLGIKNFYGGKYSRIQYGVILLESREA